jgi:hypothetical protein
MIKFKCQDIPKQIVLTNIQVKCPLVCYCENMGVVHKTVYNVTDMIGVGQLGLELGFGKWWVSGEG